ncbi:unnamed protein product [Schistosoma turkestanicum]|nr:unnamed protein product [Schistosoma turkestanicum]
MSKPPALPRVGTGSSPEGSTGGVHSRFGRLNQIIQSKQSRLCIALDILDPIKLLQLTNEIGLEICAIKLHLDILLSNQNPEMIIQGLYDLSMKYGFLIIEDR